MPGGETSVTFFGATHRGQARPANQDAYLILDLASPPAWLALESNAADPGAAPLHALIREPGMAMLVADGMGSGAGGIASNMAAKAIREVLSESHPDAGDIRLPDLLVRAIEAANLSVHRRAAAQPELAGMGTTATLAGISGRTLYVAQVGDSRAYLLRDGTLTQLTRDQSWVQRMVDQGSLTEAEAEESDYRNLILQAVGVDAAVTVVVSEHGLLDGDVLLLCSDGLSGQVAKQEIRDALQEAEDPRTACEALIDLANRSGGPDNITAVVAAFA